MKTITPALLAHLAQPVTTLAVCWQIVRLDDTVFAFTSLDKDLTVEGVLYTSTTGFSRTALTTGSTGQVDNLEVLGVFATGGVAEQDLKNGLFNYASVYLFAVNYADLTMGICRLRRGWLGECTRSPNGSFHAELRGLTQALTQEFGNVYSPLCRADLGDAQCTVPILGTGLRNIGTVTVPSTQHAFAVAPLVYPAGQMGNTAIIQLRNNVSAGSSLEISDGVHTVSYFWAGSVSGAAAFADIVALLPGALDVTVTTATLSISLVNNSGHQGNIVKSGDVALPPALSISNFATAYLDGGTVTWITGDNAGVSMELKTYDPNTSTVYLWLGMNYPIQVGDTFYYYPGCDKRRETCWLKFGNILNFRGEPDMPGLDAALAYPEV